MPLAKGRCRSWMTEVLGGRKDFRRGQKQVSTQPKAPSSPPSSVYTMYLLNKEVSQLEQAIPAVLIGQLRQRPAAL